VIDSSAFEKYMTPEQTSTFKALKGKTKNIKAQIIICSDSVEVRLIADSAGAAQYLPQIATSIGMMLNFMFGITGEIGRRS
jgi:hypothetical protein